MEYTGSFWDSFTEDELQAMFDELEYRILELEKEKALYIEVINESNNDD